MRRAIVGAGLVIAALVALVVWKTREHDAARDEQPAPTMETGSAPSVANPAVPEAPTLGAVAGEPERPQPQPLPAGANPPPLDGQHSEPAPPQKAFTPAETIAKREADLKLLDDTKARLETDLAAARDAHDDAAVHALEIRIARIGEVRKKRSAELEQLRGGGQP